MTHIGHAQVSVNLGLPLFQGVTMLLIVPVCQVAGFKQSLF